MVAGSSLRSSCISSRPSQLHSATVVDAAERERTCHVPPHSVHRVTLATTSSTAPHRVVVSLCRVSVLGVSRGLIGDRFGVPLLVLNPIRQCTDLHRLSATRRGDRIGDVTERTVQNDLTLPEVIGQAGESECAPIDSICNYSACAMISCAVSCTWRASNSSIRRSPARRPARMLGVTRSTMSRT